MYILPPQDIKVILRISQKKKKDSTSLFNTIKKDVEFLKINEGEILIFNQAYPMEISNQEQETRWSMNCRFKSLFSPYGDKKLENFCSYHNQSSNYYWYELFISRFMRKSVRGYIFSRPFLMKEHLSIFKTLS